MILNTILATNAPDPYPFILLNLVLSTIAAIQAPIIMMSQNRAAIIDRQKAKEDYEIELAQTKLILSELEEIRQDLKNNTK